MLVKHIKYRKTITLYEKVGNIMANVSDILKNLKDAGCDKSVIESNFEDNQSCLSKKQKTMLIKHRKNLLDELHSVQKKIDCLDYLLYKFEKGK